jgi:hypothetical protein
MYTEYVDFSSHLFLNCLNEPPSPKLVAIPRDFLVGLKQNIFKEPETRFVHIACYGATTSRCLHPLYLVSATSHKAVTFSSQFSLRLPTDLLSISRLFGKVGSSLLLYQNDSIRQTQSFPQKRRWTRVWSGERGSVRHNTGLRHTKCALQVTNTELINHFLG